MQKWIIFFVICIIFLIGAYIVINMKVETEYIPESEIEEEEFRKTIVTLYFKNKETGEISSETRLIDSKELLIEPYNRLIQLLLDGPENEKLEKIVPVNVKIVKVEFDKGYVNITFNEEFKNESISEETRNLFATTVYYTLSNLKEVNGIRILDGEEVLQEIPQQ